MMAPPCPSLQYLSNSFCVFALVETGLEDRIVLEIHKAEELQGAELTVFAEADFQSVVAYAASMRLALLLYFSSHLVKRHTEQVLQVFPLRRGIFQNENLDGTLCRRIDGLGGKQ